MKTYPSVVKVPHSENCFMRGQKRNPWSGVISGDQYWANYKAKTGTKTSGHLWVDILCNDPNCPARKAVHSGNLVKA